MSKIIYLFVVVMMLNGCATTSPTITRSSGNPDLTKQKTFTVKPANSITSVEYFREFRVLHNLIIRFEQEGYQFVESDKNPDLIVSVDFKDQVLQRYVPPSTHVAVTEDPGTTITNTVGNYFFNGQYGHD